LDPPPLSFERTPGQVVAWMREWEHLVAGPTRLLLNVRLRAWQTRGKVVELNAGELRGAFLACFSDALQGEKHIAQSHIHSWGCRWGKVVAPLKRWYRDFVGFVDVTRPDSMIGYRAIMDAQFLYTVVVRFLSLFQHLETKWGNYKEVWLPQ
jgi:hypothetical protein